MIETAPHGTRVVHVTSPFQFEKAIGKHRFANF